MTVPELFQIPNEFSSELSTRRNLRARRHLHRVRVSSLFKPWWLVGCFRPQGQGPLKRRFFQSRPSHVVFLNYPLRPYFIRVNNGRR